MVLDNILRDSGYCNGWDFGSVLMEKYIKYTVSTGIKFLEPAFSFTSKKSLLRTACTPVMIIILRVNGSKLANVPVKKIIL